jgi:hypothetical protein
MDFVLNMLLKVVKENRGRVVSSFIVFFRVIVFARNEGCFLMEQ